MRIRCNVLLFLLIVWVMQSCRPTRYVPEGKQLVARTSIVINPEGAQRYEGDMDALNGAIKQKPYRRLFYVVPFHISVWNFTNGRNQERRFYAYLKNTVGEAPQIYEPILLEKSKDQMQRLLRNSGYFDATVKAEAVENGKKAHLKFTIETADPYTIRKIGYAFEDTALIKEFTGGMRTSFKPGDRFDAGTFEDERDQLTQFMKNRGYFTFEKIHVIFDVDTNLPGRKFDVTVRLRNLRTSKSLGERDTVIQTSHLKHHIREITINENYDARRSNALTFDTTEFRGVTFLFYGKPPVRPLRISRNLFITPGELYALDKTNYTYQRLNALGNFRFIDMKYAPSYSDSNRADLDLRINLTKAPKQSVSVETTGTHRSGNLGISASVNYKNRNLFRGAEQLDWKVYGGLESQRTNSTESNEANEVINNVSIFNTYEFGTQVSLTIPDFLLRASRREVPWAKEPKTNISMSLDRQFRPQYERNLINTSYQYVMRIKEKDQLTIAPIDLSVISLTKTAAFEKQLALTRNALLINSYNDHIIAAGRISYANSSQDLKNEQKNFHLYRINLETSGNMLRGMSGVIGLRYDEVRQSYLINDIAFAQYVKVDVDYTQHYRLSEETKMVYRFFGGMGLPLRNLNVLPFERSFFAGGSNDIRAWRARALGPGSLSDTATYGIDQVAESQLELNLEYRFHIIKQIEGAVFTDIGNIWLIREDAQRPGAHFSPTRFYKELAVAPGIGARLNFNFFILRLDGGLQLKDPSLPTGERWLFQPKTLTEQYRSKANENRVLNGLSPVAEWDRPYRPQFTLNLAIGYPF